MLLLRGPDDPGQISYPQLKRGRLKIIKAAPFLLEKVFLVLILSTNARNCFDMDLRSLICHVRRVQEPYFA